MFYISYLGLLIAFILFLYRNKELSTNYTLAFFYLFNSIFGIVHNVLFSSSNPTAIAIFTNHFMPFYFLVGPSLFYFIKRTYISDKKTIYDYLHGIPFWLVFINISPYIFSSWAEKIEYANQILHHSNNQYEVKFLFMSSIWQSVLRPFINIVYGIVCFYIYLLHYDKRIFKVNKMNDAFCWWVGVFLFIFILANLASFLLVSNLILQDKIHLNLFNVLPLDIIQSLVVFAFFFQNLVILFIPFILFGSYFKSDYIIENKLENALKNAENTNLEKEDLGILNEEKINEISQGIAIVQQNNDCISNDFSLSKMALEIGVPYHVLTVYFSKYLKISFPEWKNRQRIEFVQKKLKEGLADNVTLESIGEMAGFNSRSSFLKVFKKYTGITPSQFLNK